MRKISFQKFIPGGNPTILIPSVEIPAGKRAAVAEQLMRPLHLQAEQVGFTDPTTAPPRLEMMGGEFCLNATRCLVFEAARLNRFLPLADTDDLFGLVASSGVAEALPVRVKNGKIALRESSPESLTSLDCLVSLKIVLDAESRREIEPGALLLRLPGISHLLLNEKLHPLPADPLDGAAAWRQRLGLDAEPACGVVWHCELKTGPDETVLSRGIIPVVRVAETNSSILESACGSGTLALGLQALLEAGRPAQAQPLFMNVRQPSGEFLRLKIEGCPATPEETDAPSFNCTAEVGGPVSICASGQAFVSLPKIE